MTKQSAPASAEQQFKLLQAKTRRTFLGGAGLGLAGIALADLERQANAADALAAAKENPLAEKKPHFAPKAKRVIYLHMSGGPPQQELFDYKPKLQEHHLQPCPAELLKNQRFAFIRGTPKLLGCPYKFAQHGKSGAWVSELLPEFSKQADQVAFLKGMWTDQFNHAPAELFLYTGSSRAGAAAIGSWITWGLGSLNQDLPGFVVLVSGGTDPTGGKSLWSSGFLPSVHQGVQCRTSGDPILYVTNPPGMSSTVRRDSLDALQQLNELELAASHDPETATRISQYELAYRMQISVPEVMDVRQESKATLAAYGAEPGKSSFANNCLLARRLVEKGVRYVQLYDWGWDIHGTGAGDDIMNQLPKKCQQVDKPIAALLVDLKQRGLLDDTLVVWGGEFGRTAMNEARGGSTYLGRDHHPHCFSMWMAGAGVKPGVTHGATDELGYFIDSGKTTVNDLQATILHLLGLDAWKLRFPFQGLDQRLIGPEGHARVIQEVLV